jgi:hypothetical protein
MHLPAVIFLSAGVAVAESLAGYSPNAPRGLDTVNRKRQLPTCDQTYGTGSVNCGGANSSFCFNPTLGQVNIPDSSVLSAET